MHSEGREQELGGQEEMDSLDLGRL